MSVQDLPGAMGGLERVTQLVTNPTLQLIFKTTLRGVTASARRVVRLAEMVKKNMEDFRARALHIADISEKSIRRAVFVSDNGVVGDALLTKIIRWQ
ncbi:hypothetical protein FRB97_004850 [Tulasnella sp. 331]|nr:hypothetical protein FRB97_004850 [Tulasnella sp. 331]